MSRRAYTRQKKQKGLSRLKAQKYYRQNRGRLKSRARKRYRKVRKQPSFKKKQRIRRKKPWLFKRKTAQDFLGETLTHTDIAFIHPETEEVVGLRSLNTTSGMINYQISDSDFGMISINDVMENALFPSWEDIEDFYDLLDRAYLTDDELTSFEESDEEDEKTNGGDPEKTAAKLAMKYLFTRGK